MSKLEEIYGLKKYVPQLTYLDMSDNPLCDDKSYRCEGSGHGGGDADDNEDGLRWGGVFPLHQTEDGTLHVCQAQEMHQTAPNLND